MNLYRFTIFLIIILVFVGCQTNSSSDNVALMTADKQWSAAIEEGDIDKIVSFWTDNAVVYFPDRPAVVGKNAILSMVKTNRRIPGFSMSRKPAEVLVSSSGDLGYTLGIFDLTLPGADGTAIKKHGNYVGVWNKQTDGTWKCSLSIGNFRSATTGELNL